MIMVADLLPGLKRFLRTCSENQARRAMIIRVIVAFIMHRGRMSCLQAAGADRSQPRHRAQVARFLGRAYWVKTKLVETLWELMLLACAEVGLYVLLFDATSVSQQGKKTENTHSTGNRKRRPRKGRRHSKYKHARKTCHTFTMGLLITPSGRRLPVCRPYRTRDYCEAKGIPHLTTAEAAAEVIRELKIPLGSRVVVLGDTAYDAKVMRKACDERRFTWIFPCNPERVLAGPKGKRPKVRSLLKDLSLDSLQLLRLQPGQGQYAVYRRLSPHRVGPKAKPRTYHVHQERRKVHSVGDVQLVFSTMNPHPKQTPDDFKILMTNDLRLKPRDIVELYSLRWQIELFFKELKSTLGFHQYQFRQFERVEAWTELALTTFLYLEWYRVQQIARRGLTDKERQWWRNQRTHGLCQAVTQASQKAELDYIATKLENPRGVQILKRLIRNSYPKEYRMAA